MVPTLLITVREVIEASLIIATIIGILYKIGDNKGIRTVWLATGCAVMVSVLLLVITSLLGLQLQQYFAGDFEKIFEGTLLIISAMFITWAVFFLHAMFAKKKVAHLRKVNDIVERQEQSALFILAFSAVIREGLEITLFLSTLFLTSQPIHIFLGFSIGIVMGILISFAFFSATLRLPVYYAFRVTSFLLILFAAGMLARGMQEFNELALIPSMAFKPFFFLPDPESIIGQFITSILGVWKHMDGIQVSAYALYAGFMAWRVFIKRETIDS